MAWALWLAIPIVATLVAAVATWWPAHRARASRQPDTDTAMQAHRDYLDALVLPARGTRRVGSAEGSGPAARGRD
jgi:hypothetical protein